MKFVAKAQQRFDVLRKGKALKRTAMEARRQLSSAAAWDAMVSNGKARLSDARATNGAAKQRRRKARIGSWITLSEWKYSGAKERYVPVCVKTEYVDGERIKADTWYMLKNGEFVEVQDE